MAFRITKPPVTQQVSYLKVKCSKSVNIGANKWYQCGTIYSVKSNSKWIVGQETCYGINESFTTLKIKCPSCAQVNEYNNEIIKCDFAKPIRVGEDFMIYKDQIKLDDLNYWNFTCGKSNCQTEFEMREDYVDVTTSSFRNETSTKYSTKCPTCQSVIEKYD